MRRLMAGSPRPLPDSPTPPPAKGLHPSCSFPHLRRSSGPQSAPLLPSHLWLGRGQPWAPLPILPPKLLWNLPLHLHNDQQSKHQPQMQQRLLFLKGKWKNRRRNRVQKGRKEINIADK